MHLAYDIKADFFDIAIEDQPASRQNLLGWDLRDRLGIVVDRPFGALDAALMIMVAATAFYDASKKRRMRPLYPDMFLFHAGGPWGAHATLDFAPDHKEIFARNTPQELLRAINHVGITHLLLPDRQAHPVKHRFKEPEAALDRLKMVFAYGPPGEVASPDVRITATPFAPLIGTFESTLVAEPYLAMLEKMGSAPETRATDKAELDIMLPMLRARLHEVLPDDPDYLRHLARLEAARSAGTTSEDYRRVPPEDALSMLRARPG
jgi:hypothetical protein